MKTFTSTITVSDELVQGLAINLMYQPTLRRQITVVDEEDSEGTIIASHFETEEYDNPESADDFVTRLAKDHIAKFFLPFGETLVQNAISEARAQVAVAETQAREQIIQPMVDALTVDVVDVTVE